MMTIQIVHINTHEGRAVVVLPVEAMAKLGLSSGDPLQMTLTNAGIELAPCDTESQVVGSVRSD